MTRSRRISVSDLNQARDPSLSASSSSTDCTRNQQQIDHPLDTSSASMAFQRDLEKGVRYGLGVPIPDIVHIPTETSQILEAGAFNPLESVNITPSHDDEVRPFNFGLVMPGVYRSSYPQDHDYDFIRNLGLKSVVTLVQKEMPPSYKPFLDAHHINHHVFDMKGTKKENIPIETMRGILKVVLDSRHHPLLIHCNHGKHRTGCVVGVVRMLAGWPLPMVHHEYRQYADPKVRDTDLEYLANFNIAQLGDLFPRPPMAITQRRLTQSKSAAFFLLVVLFYMAYRLTIAARTY